MDYASKRRQKVNSEYTHNRTRNIFAFPLGGMPHVSVLEYRTAKDWTEEIKYLSDVINPNAAIKGSIYGQRTAVQRINNHLLNH